MTTITINEKTKAGKTFLEFAKNLDFIKIENLNEIEIPIPEKDLSIWQTPLSFIQEENDNYNPEFVAMVKKAQKSKKRTILNPNDIWGSLGLK